MVIFKSTSGLVEGCLQSLMIKASHAASSPGADTGCRGKVVDSSSAVNLANKRGPDSINIHPANFPITERLRGKFSMNKRTIKTSWSPLVVGGLLFFMNPAAHAAPTCDVWGCASSAQPVLSVPYPNPIPIPTSPTRWSDSNPPPRTEGLLWGDFDSDGVVNWKDNCPLVSNRDQAPALPTSTSLLPNASLSALARQWKAANPSSMFRLSTETGAACSPYNDNYRRTFEAFRLMPESRRKDVYRFLQQGGPMLGSSTLVFNAPLCTSDAVLTDIVDFALNLPKTDWRYPFLSGAIKPLIQGNSGCEAGSNFTTSRLTTAIWAGKRLNTPIDSGGTITNRFFPDTLESYWFSQNVQKYPGYFPGPGNTGQTVNGFVGRGKSYIDGRPVISLDWRAVKGAGLNGVPIANMALKDFINLGVPRLGDMVQSLTGVDVRYLIGDECRAIQEGLWLCPALIDMVRNKDGARKLFQEGWMPWNGINSSISDHYAWQRANPQWLK